MEVTFAMLCEQLEKETPSPLMSSGEETRAMSVIRSGNDLRNEDETSFWDDFINLCVNADGMAELLGVPEDKVRGWPHKIKEHQEKIKNHDAQNPAIEDDMAMMPTGDTGAVTTNSDPYLEV